MLQWARANGCAWVSRGQLRTDAHGIAVRHTLGDSVLMLPSYWAAKGGHLEVLKWVTDNGCPMNRHAWDTAVAGGHVAVLVWLMEHFRSKQLEASIGYATRTTCVMAAENGQLAVLQWAREMDCEWDAGTCGMAARGGHLAVLQWARANGCAWNSGTCIRAAQGGHLQVLQWARSNSCPWDEYVSLLHIPDVALSSWSLLKLPMKNLPGPPWGW